jgi:hypothetical protein
MVFTTSGFLGVGVLAPARQLDVNGRARIESIPPEASAASVCFNAQGDLLQCGASSLRLKKNVLAFSGGLNIIRRLKPIRFDWRDGSGHDIGLGAEDVARVEPFLTFKDRDGQVAGVKYERLNILLINAVKEQQAQIERQQQQIKQAEATNQQQQQQLKRQQGELDGLKKLVCLDHPNAEVCRPEIKP